MNKPTQPVASASRSAISLMRSSLMHRLAPGPLQSVSQRYLCQVIHPIGGVRAKPLSSANASLSQPRRCLKLTELPSWREKIQIDGMAHQTNSNDTCPRIFRNANRRPWVSNVHDEWGCIINKIHGGKYLWGKNTETSTFQNHLDHKCNPETFTNFLLYLPWWLANNANHPYHLSLSTVPLDPVSYITSVLSLVELQDSASATTTSVDALQRSLQACQSRCLCLWVSWCQGWEKCNVNERLEPALSFPGQWPQGTGKSSPRSRLMIFKVRHLLTEILSPLLRLQRAFCFFLCPAPHTRRAIQKMSMPNDVLTACQQFTDASRC